MNTTIFHNKWSAFLILAGVSIVAFFPLLNNNFVNYDDPGYITQNQNVRSGISLKTIVWAFKSNEQSNWHPLTWMSHALDYQLFGLNPTYHHLMNLLLHIISSVLLFIFLKKATDSHWQSLFVAVVFAIHPLHVESVAWASERKDVLSGLFWMLTMWAYIRYRQVPGLSRYMLVLFLFSLGILSKPMIITLPFVLILLDYWPLNHLSFKSMTGKKEKYIIPTSLVNNIKDKIPFFILSLGSSIITYIVQREGGSMAESGGLLFKDRLFNAVLSYSKYIVKTFIPTDLSVFYPHPANNINLLLVFFSFIILLSFTWFVWKRRSTLPFLFVGWFWFLGTLVPVIGIVQVGLQSMADRYMYLPMIGLTITIAWGLPIFLRRHIQNPKHIFTFGFVAVSLMMTFVARTQTEYWKDSKTLFQHALSVTSDNDIAYTNLGVDYADSGKHRDAVYNLRKAYQLKPNEVGIRSNLAKALASIGEYDEALDHYNWLLKKVKPDPRLYLRIGNVHADEGRYDEAVVYFLKSIELDSSNAFTHCQLGEVYIYQGKYIEAKQECTRALQIDSTYAEAHNILGVLAGKQQQYDLALDEFSEAIRLDSLNSDYYTDLGVLYDKMNQFSNSEYAYKKAIALNQNNLDACFNLGLIYGKQKKYHEAEDQWRRIILIDTVSINVRMNLAMLYEVQDKKIQALDQYVKIIRMEKKNAVAYYFAGILFEKLNKLSEAEEHFRGAIKIAPTYRDPQIALQRILSSKNK
ncbi:MAG: tetratricopeptide repeat protein [Ignavibacteriales bacterium]|nr:tetratricopeptide repeat protein [Ignavibacteriales bacterium]